MINFLKKLIINLIIFKKTNLFLIKKFKLFLLQFDPEEWSNTWNVLTK